MRKRLKLFLIMLLVALIVGTAYLIIKKLYVTFESTARMSDPHYIENHMKQLDVVVQDLPDPVESTIPRDP